MTVSSGDLITFKWSGINGATSPAPVATWTCTRESGAACPAGTWTGVGNSLSGSSTYTFADAHKGITYVVTYKVNKTGGGFATDVVTIHVNE